MMANKVISELSSENDRKKSQRVYVGFMDLKKKCDMVNREALWKVLQEQSYLL